MLMVCGSIDRGFKIFLVLDEIAVPLKEQLSRLGGAPGPTAGQAGGGCK